jgi:hypothetical protein
MIPNESAPRPTSPKEAAPATFDYNATPSREPFWPYRGWALIIAALALVAVPIGIWCVVHRLPDEKILDLVVRHGPAIVGIPAAALLSLAAVALARGLGGPTTIQIIGLHAEGATATFLLWLGAFLACVFAIRALW